MPLLTDSRKTKEVELPGHPGSKVVVYDGMLARDFEPGLGTGDVEGTLRFLAKMIKEWNFTDEAGAAVPVGPDALKMLRLEDLRFLGEVVTEFSAAQKKS